MQKIEIALGERSYEVTVGSGVRELAARIPGRRLLAADSTVARLYGNWAESVIAPEVFATFPAGEESKTFATVAGFCSRAAAARLDRRSVFIAMGGGVTGDLVGFAAAIYMRGVDFYQIPTTLLAMVDSSVGGKTGADLPEGKNLIGAFHQPRGVFIDPDFLATLDAATLADGLAEVVKTAVILDGGLFSELEHAPEELLAASPRYAGIIARCCELKGAVVADDEREAGRRAILNYGHTVGHAVELLSNFTLPHGAAVAIGMAAAGRMAVLTGRLTERQLERQNALLSAFGLPLRVPGGITAAAIIDAMRGDKKAAAGRPAFVLPRTIGQAEVVRELPDAVVAAGLQAVGA